MFSPIRIAAIPIAALFLAAACIPAVDRGPDDSPGDSTLVVDGVVTAVEGSSPADVSRFTLRTSDGRLLDFAIGRLDLSSDAFPAGHLREHLATAQPVRVTYVEGASTRIAVRLEDGPP